MHCTVKTSGKRPEKMKLRFVQEEWSVMCGREKKVNEMEG